MIKRVYRSKLDIENLSKLRTSIPSEVDNFDYKKIVVNKPWGYEYLMYENGHVAIWTLYLKKAHSTSMHSHPNKKSSLVVLCGSVICSNLDGWVKRKQGEGMIIDEGVFHSTKAVSRGGAIIMEIESPPNKKDLVRLKDEYGRENSGYEGKDKMTNQTSDFEYVDFHDFNLKSKLLKNIRDCKISFGSSKRTPNFHKKLRKESGSIICLLKGKLHDKNGRMLLDTGEVSALEELKKLLSISIFDDIIYLTLTYKRLN